MQVTFVSNYINHHQIPLSNALYKVLGENYHFIQTEPMEEERAKMGWQSEVGNIPYLLCSYENKEECDKLLMESDIVIYGGLEQEDMVVKRLEKGLFTIRYAERIYKTGQYKRISPRGLKEKYHNYIRFRKQSFYLLCAGGYVADDYHLIGAFPKKMMKWGYFPKNIKYDIDKLLEEKEKKKRVRLLWTGRMISWKHPEYALFLAKYLKDSGYKFELKMIGEGEKESEIQKYVHQFHLEKEVSVYPFMKPCEVRKEMEQADIYLMTSDRMEGWGAVVNESMNSGCVVVASHMVGATPFLIEHQKNGLIFQSGNMKSFIKEVEKVIDNTSYRKEIGKSAYETIDRLWNAEVAAKRLLEFCEHPDMNRYDKGPASVAEPIREYKMYRKKTKGKSER